MQVHPYRNKGLKNYPDFVPNAMLSEEWAQHNHGQTLLELHNRGGLGVAEILANIDKQRKFDGKDTQEKIDRLNKLISEFNPIN